MNHGLDESVEASHAFALTDPKGPATKTVVPEPVFDANKCRRSHKQQKLTSFIQQYKDDFSSSSSVHQTPLARHRIPTYEYSTC